MSATLKRAHCMADGQLTPPSSPDAVRRALPRSKLQISKFLRRPKIVKKDTALTSHRVESTVTRSVNDRMDPFPLLLPASPLDSENSSTLTVSPVPQPELRRMSTSYDLRSIAARHSVFKATPVSTPLLPSPIDQGTSEADQSYFRFHNPRALPPCEEDYTSYEDLHILSCYYDGSKPGSMDEIEKALEEDDCLSQGSLMSEDVDGDSDSTETEVPRTPPEQINCSTACSSEGNWLASDQSHEERLRRFKARCYQVVQHPMSDRRDKREVDDQIVGDHRYWKYDANMDRCLQLSSLDQANPNLSRSHVHRQAPHDVTRSRPPSRLIHKLPTEMIHRYQLSALLTHLATSHRTTRQPTNPISYPHLRVRHTPL